LLNNHISFYKKIHSPTNEPYLMCLNQLCSWCMHPLLSKT
jgi:hypothetical protein